MIGILKISTLPYTAPKTSYSYLTTTFSWFLFQTVEKYPKYYCYQQSSTSSSAILLTNSRISSETYGRRAGNDSYTPPFKRPWIAGFSTFPIGVLYEPDNLRDSK